MCPATCISQAVIGPDEAGGKGVLGGGGWAGGGAADKR